MMEDAREAHANEFLFQIPEANGNISDAANTTLQIGALAERLTAELRTDCDHMGGRAENVAEHSLMLAKVAPELALLLYPELNTDLVARFATLHDDVEAYVGDTPTTSITPEGLHAKEQLELAGLNKLKQDYAQFKSYVKLVEDYHEQRIPEARFVRVVDKIVVLTAHFNNDGAVLGERYTRDDLLEFTRVKAEALRAEYPEFEAAIAVREELCYLAADNFLTDNT